MRVTKNSTCISPIIKEQRDKCQKIHEYSSLQKLPKKNFDPTYAQPWKLKIGPYTTTATKKKKAAVLAEINKLGYVLDDSQTRITSELFEKRERSVTICFPVGLVYATLAVEDGNYQLMLYCDASTKIVDADVERQLQHASMTI